VTLGGLLECVCGRRLRGDGRFADGRHRKLHVGPCAEWGSQARYGDETWEAPMLAQAAAIELDDGVIARVVAALASGDRPITLDRARVEREMRDLAARHLAGQIEDDAYLARLRLYRSQLSSIDQPPGSRMAAERAVAWLRAIAETLVAADVPEAKAELLHAIYERIEVRGPTIVRVHLTPSAYANGLALALPQVVKPGSTDGLG